MSSLLPSTSLLPVARLRGPGDIAAALPHLCGFVPTESLVVVALQGPRSRVRLTMRIDLPPVGHEQLLAGEVLLRMRHAEADAVIVAVCSDEAHGPGGLPRRQLVRRLRRTLERAGIGLDDALLVGDGRWWSYSCKDPRCCPAEGTPLSVAGGRGLTLLQAQSTLQGRAVLASRDDLVEALAPPAGDDAEGLRRLFDAADAERVRDVADRAVAGAAVLEQWRRQLQRAAEPPLTIDEAAAARLVCSLADVVVRDEVSTWLLDDDAALLTLLLALAARCPAPWDAPVCALLGWVAHSRGDGGLANVALDRALASQPGYTLALLSRQALDGQLPPAEVRSLVAGSRRLLRSAHPWTAP